jgi:hypothetical protein
VHVNVSIGVAELATPVFKVRTVPRLTDVALLLTVAQFKPDECIAASLRVYRITQRMPLLKRLEWRQTNFWRRRGLTALLLTLWSGFATCDVLTCLCRLVLIVAMRELIGEPHHIAEFKSLLAVQRDFTISLLF